MTHEQRRIARARLLRREGKTYDEIRAALDADVSDDRLQRWLRGIPRPPQTRRSHPKTELRRRCRELRAQGLTYDEIAAVTGASKGSISPWVRDIRVVGAAQRRRVVRVARGRTQTANRNRERAQAVRDRQRSAARAALGAMSDRDLFIAGVALYWAEGSKDKPWRRSGKIELINSDPTVLDVFLAWLELVGVPEEDRTYRLSIHENADVAAQERWWAERLGIPLNSFSGATLKRHNPTTIRNNVGETYHGCLIVRVARSGWLYYSVEGWWSALSSPSLELPTVGCQSNPSRVV